MTNNSTNTLPPDEFDDDNAELTVTEDMVTDATELNDDFEYEETQIISGGVLKGRFDLLEVIGEGGMGTVYKAVDKRDIEVGNSKFIAIKILKDQFKLDNNLLKALHAETRKTQSIGHPNIVTVYDFDRDGSSVFMTMEYIDGVPLKNIIKSSPEGLKKEDALSILNQLGSALIFAHSNNITHMDLKPSNIFLDASKHVKIFDFGISRVTNIYQSQGFDAGILGGLTPSYASLEMFQQEIPDPRDDIYALACMTYELLSGVHPFDRVRADKALVKNLKPSKISCLSNHQWKTLIHGLKFKREERIPSVEKFLQGMSVESKNKLPLVIGFAVLTLIPVAYYMMQLSEEHTVSKPLSQEIAKVESSPVESINSQQEAIISSEKMGQIENKTSNITTETVIAKINNKSINHLPDESSQVLLDDATPLKKVHTEQATHEIEVSKTGSLIAESVSPTQKSQNILLKTNQRVFKIGDSLVLDFMVTTPTYVAIVVVNSAGDISMLYPNPFQQDSLLDGGVNYQVPPVNAEFNILIEEPIGEDEVLAVMSSQEIDNHKITSFSNPNALKKYLNSENLKYSSIRYQIMH